MNPLWMVMADLRKTALTNLGILLLLAFAFSATIAVSLFERAVREAGASSAQDVDLVVGAPGSRLDLILAAVFVRTDEVLPLVGPQVVERLETDPRVVALSPLVFADSHRGFPVVGVGTAFPQLKPSLRLTQGRWPEAPFEVVAGWSTDTPQGAEFHSVHGKAEGEENEHHEGEFTVVGVLARSGTPWDRAYLTPVEGIWHLHEEEAAHGESSAPGQVSAILVKPRDFASAYALRSEYREGETTAAFPGEVLSGLFGLFDEAKKLLTGMASLFQTLVFFAVLLSLMASLPSKARWIGLLRALGATPLYVFLTLWVQAALMFTLATLAGAGVGWVGAELLARYVSDHSGLVLAPSWSMGEGGLLGFYWTLGLVGALVPAFVGYRTSVRRSLLGQ